MKSHVSVRKDLFSSVLTVAKISAPAFFADGLNHDRNGETTDGTDELICEMYLGERGFEACRRSDFQQRIFSVLPDGCVKFSKNLLSVKDNPRDENILLEFEVAQWSRQMSPNTFSCVVIGCDGINSKMRSITFGPQTSRPAYSHKFAYRGLIDADDARRVVGVDKANGRFIYMGADAHVLTCPVAGGRMVNVVAFVTDSSPWVEE
ncbi:hypothetical protein BKA67DRAFT_659891 [Truncatella angustata]|uniref:FAD-binding domain-containing protein n=1 Tax=Truncatella angustata TaxID=152316 RepID=A0A9P8UJG3_9PEZI|nr:uncharacterized protein BKA67DRAFT_659891 [Truncatella angustata]KAH6653257.1 hypothetical protein BKA67DRAFT_659891 [Truncatella angustata]